MKRVLRLALVTLLIGHAVRADDTRTSTQSYVLHVPAKVSLERAEIPAQAPGESASTSDGEPVEAAFRLSATGAAGITAQFEVHSATPRGGTVAASARQMSLRITADDESRWSVEVDGQPRETDATGSKLQVSSRSAGAATLVISSAGQEACLEIITTIISND